ncbi:MAG TPA: Ig-like domain-containing protein, partial [Polyangia bacterium]|nr:Ig-like domain-containing protein [Polyangia bacterium]
MLVVCTAVPARAQSCYAGDGVTLWLDFEGAGVVEAANDDSSAMPVQSRLAPTSAVVPPFDSAPIAPQVTRDQAIAAVVDRVRTLLKPFAVAVVTTRPPYAPYTRILIGGTQTAIGLSSIEAGLAEIDCDNTIDDDVAFDFAAEQTPDYGGVVGIANVAAHEAGHTFGLEHVTTPTDVMYAAATPDLTLPQLFSLSFAGGAYTSYGGAATSLCGNDPADEVALLDCNVGAAIEDGGDGADGGVDGGAAGDTTPPTLDWPATTGEVPTSFAVNVSASDDVGVTRVEFYKNLELVAAVTTPPYTATITAASSEQFYVTVEAIDDAANRETVTRAFAAEAVTPAVDAGVSGGGTNPPVNTTTATKVGGCSMADRAAP